MRPQAINHDLHNALVLATAPLLIIMPFVLEFTPGIGLISALIGALIVSVALAGATPERALPMTAQAGFDWILGLGLVGLGLFAGLTFSVPVQTIFLVGFGAAHLVLAASTRYSARSA